MNFAPFNVLEFDGAFPQLTIASWLPMFPQPGRLTIYADGTTLASIQLVKTIPGIPDPWRATTARSGPAPKKGVVIREPAGIVSSPPVFKYQAPPALPSNVGYMIVSVPDPWRSTSTPIYGPFKPFIIPQFLSWQPTIIQPGRPILRAPGTSHVKDDWRFPEAVSADKWQATTVQPSRSILRASGTSAVDRLLEIIFADKWQPTTVQPGRAIVRAKGTEFSWLQELPFADKWLPTWNQPSRQVIRAVGTNLVGHDIMPFDLLIPLSQATVSITGGISLSSTAFGRMHVCTGTSTNYTVNLPSPTNNGGSFIGFIMGSGLTKLVTIAQNAAEKIDGANSRVMWASEVAILFCDGTNWIKVYGKSIPMACQIYPSVNQSIPNNTFTLLTLDSTSRDNTGLQADLANHQIKVVRGGSYQIVATAIWAPVGASANTQMQVYKNGAEDNAVALVPISGSSFPSMSLVYENPSVVAGDLFTLLAYQLSGVSATIAGTAIATSLGLYEIPSW